MILFQVHSTSKKLLYQLDHLVQVCNQPPQPGLPDHRKHVCILFIYILNYKKMYVKKDEYDIDSLIKNVFLIN